MSVFVIGMKMPDNCHVCGLCFGGLCYSCPPEVEEMCPDSGRPEWCPLRPLPEKHGRLIDESWIKKSLSITLESLKKHPQMNGYEMHLIAAFDTLMLMLDKAPTVIEAEGD